MLHKTITVRAFSGKISRHLTNQVPGMQSKVGKVSMESDETQKGAMSHNVAPLVVIGPPCVGKVSFDILT